jgi:uncharacterized protein (TIGR03083 family)
VKDPLEVIARESALFAATATGNLHAQVPSCPEWNVGDLVAHLGAVQRFHALHVTRGVSDPPTDRPAVPEGDDGLIEWFDEGTRALLGALKAVEPETPAWNWAAHTPQVAAFWPRRMALEAAVHRWDCQSARNDASGFDIDVALDGIDEVLAVHLPTQDQQPAGSVRVELTDSDATWVVGATQKTPDAVLSGTSSGVFLALWGRVPLSSLQVSGDESLVAALRTG